MKLWKTPRLKAEEDRRDPVVAPPSSPRQTLREFVYLDEVSVYSLTSSPDSPPASAISETVSAESGSEWGTTADVGTPVLARAGVNASFSSADTTALEIQRRFNVQSLFAVLHRAYSNDFRLRSPGIGDPSATQNNTQMSQTSGQDQEAVSAVLSTLQTEQRAVRVSSLRRGDLLELPIALSAHPVFAITTSVQEIGSLIEKYPSLTGGLDASTQLGLEAASSLRQLMTDLVPIEGVAARHSLVTHEDECWIVENAALVGALSVLQATASPLRVVGVTEIDRYWKDTMRVLHADLEYDVLARISTPALRSEWSPIKMVQAFEKAVPGLGAGLAAVIDNLPQAMSGSSGPSAGTTAEVSAGVLLGSFAAHYDVQLDDRQTAAFGSVVGTPNEADFEEQLSALARGLDELHALFPGLERDHDAEGRMRQDAWRLAEIAVGHELPAEADSSVEPAPENLLEVEFVGIYW